MNGKIVKATDRQVTAPVTFLNTLRRDFHFQRKKERERIYEYTALTLQWHTDTQVQHWLIFIQTYEGDKQTV